MNADKRRSESRIYSLSARRILALSASICVYLWLISSCSSKPSDLRTLAPADSLVYLETNDLAAALQPIVDSKPFTEAAKNKPDLSALKGVQLAVAITGFETSEEKLTDEHSVGKVQPHFVAIAETHAWQFQTVRFAEQKLGSFVEEIYGSEPTLEKSEKGGGHYLVWTAKDGRKAFAVVSRSLIYFSNDETAIEKCLAVSRGEADSIAKTGKVPPAAPATLASGYISTDGVAQIANIAALRFAADASEEPEVQSAAAGLFPQLIRGLVTDVTWTQIKADTKIEDRWEINMQHDVAAVLNETLGPSGDLSSQQESRNRMVSQLPPGIASATRYNFKDPVIAWRSMVLILNQRFDPLSRKIVGVVLGSAFEQYGIRDPEGFLKTLGDGGERTKNIITVKPNSDGTDRVLIATVGDDTLARKAFYNLTPEEAAPDGYSYWKTKDGEVSVRFEAGLLTARPVDLTLFSPQDKPGQFPAMLLQTSAPISTIDRDVDATAQIIEAFSEKKSDATQAQELSLTETRFTRSGMERKTTSDFGFIGWIIAQLNDD